MEEDFPRGRKPRPVEKDTEEKKNVPYHVQKKRMLDDDYNESSKETKRIEDLGGDLLFGVKPSKKPKVKKPKEVSEEEAMEAAVTSKHSLLPLGGGGVVMKRRFQAAKAAAGSTSTKGKAEPFIEALGFSRLAKGTKLLGVVREVQEEFALVSLPNLLTGYVLRNEVNSIQDHLSLCFLFFNPSCCLLRHVFVWL